VRQSPEDMHRQGVLTLYSGLPHLRGGVAEWLNATVLKTVGPQGLVGSNPTPSATPAKAAAFGGVGACGLPAAAGALALARSRILTYPHKQ
jgi:hypothetical protein